jgi:DNA invertase Pin-like site-specific DNA recombinase
MGDKFVGLVRVSTREQKESGLGLAAGYRDIEAYVKYNNGELVAILEEVGSATHDDMIDRPVLLRALSLCQRHPAILLVPKFDRLLRSTNVHTDIKRMGVSFRAVDNPTANEFTIDIHVAVAAEETRKISSRTKAGLKSYREDKEVSVVQMTKLLLKYCRDIPPAEVEAAVDKKRMALLVARYGHEIPPEAIEAVAGKLGSHLTGSRLSPEQRAKGRAKANARSRQKSVDLYAYLLEEMRAWRAGGMTLQAIANTLNDRGEFRKSRAKWTPVQVKRLLDRAKG